MCVCACVHYRLSYSHFAPPDRSGPLLLPLPLSHDSHEDLDESPSASPRPHPPKMKKEDPDVKSEGQGRSEETKKESIGTTRGGGGAGRAVSGDKKPPLGRPQHPPCPVPGCDSSGHLSGMYERHSVRIACPLYHNTTPEECVEKCNTRREREKRRKDALDGDKYVDESFFRTSFFLT